MVIAIIAIRQWKKEHVLIRASDKALSLISKVKLLHYDIIALRAPKFRESDDKKRIDTLLDEITEISKSCALINQELIDCQYRLINGKNINDLFDKKINKKVLFQLRMNAYRLFRLTQEGRNESNKQEIHNLEVFFVPETLPGEWEKTPAGYDFPKDKFSQEMKENFDVIIATLDQDIIKSNSYSFFTKYIISKLANSHEALHQNRQSTTN